MKKSTFVILLMLLSASLSVFQACDKDDDTETEFVADDNTFQSFNAWYLHASHQGPDPALGVAHAGNDTSVTRKVYFKDNQNAVNGKYPVGTIIVKHSSNGTTVDEYTAMVKRGNGFSPDTNDWEWFMLAPDGTIAKDPTGALMRGAKLMGGMCNGCHTQAAAKDYVFSK